MNEISEEWSTTDSNLRNRNSKNDEDRGANTSIDADELDEELPKMRGKARLYIKIQEFRDYVSATDFMDSNDEYTFRGTKESHFDGDKDWYFQNT